MRVGIALSGRRSAADAVDLAVQAERLGFAEVWLTEDYFERGAFALAGAVAASTRSLMIGVGVVNPWTRNPMLTAMEAATLAELAPQRSLLGIGASNRRWIEDQLGIPFQHPLAALEEAVVIIRTALGGNAVNRPAGIFPTEASLSFSPPLPIPIVLGVKGCRALELAGRVGDAVLLSILSSPEYVEWSRSKAPGLPVSSYVAFSCMGDHQAARERLRPFVARFLGVHGNHPITSLAGLTPDLAHLFRSGLLAGSPRVDLVGDAVLDATAIAGDPEHCATGLRRFEGAGLDTAVFHDRGDDDPAVFLEAIVQVAALAGIGIE